MQADSEVHTRDKKVPRAVCTVWYKGQCVTVIHADTERM